MFKRMSVLTRRADHDRATFSALWQRHAAPVSGLPRVRGYIQNHVEEDYGPASPIKADGFVELLWDRPEDMAAAFASEAARPMVEDEPGFLGHGSGYALASVQFLDWPHASKLIVAAAGEGVSNWRGVEELAADLPLLGELWRDDVTALIPKPGMAPPQPVDAFFHLWFESVTDAEGAAVKLAALPVDGVALGIYRVRTIRFV